MGFCWLPPVLTSNCDGDLKKAFNECLGVSNVFPTTALIQAVTYHHEVASRPLGEVNRGKFFGFSIGGPTDELHIFTKSSETGLG